MEPTSNQNNSTAIPIAIVVGFAMIAIAIFFTGGKEATPQKVATNTTGEETEIAANSPRPLDDSDYIRGNPNAPIVMIEYSDYDCPFCKQFHETMNQVINEYGVSGKLAWAYRQFPLAQLHPNAPKISEAALCVGDISGDDAFWQFSDLIFEQRELDEPTNVTKLPDYAELVGVDKSDYISCMQSGRMKAAVETSIEDGFNSGARGTPYTILIAGNQQAVINGAQSYATVSGIVSNLIDQLDGNFDPASVDTSTQSEI